MRGKNIPHPIPYQGSKRNLAEDILRYFPLDFDTLYEAFAGSAAMTIAAAYNRRGRRYHINDLNKPLMDLWQSIIETPDTIAKQYEELWTSQLDDSRAFYNRVRDDFNRTGRPDLFLYMLARCVKGSVRYNANGEFNQSPDHRRLGMRPKVLHLQATGVSQILKGKTTVSSVNYRDVLDMATSSDLVYLDPPYQGVCGNRDSRYLHSIQFYEFVEALAGMNERSIRYLVSYDGRTGDKVYGQTLPAELDLTLIELVAGRSTQATLLGRDDVTVESLYLSPALSEELHVSDDLCCKHSPRGIQLCLTGENNGRAAITPGICRAM